MFFTGNLPKPLLVCEYLAPALLEPKFVREPGFSDSVGLALGRISGACTGFFSLSFALSITVK